MANPLMRSVVQVETSRIKEAIREVFKDNMSELRAVRDTDEKKMAALKVRGMVRERKIRALERDLLQCKNDGKTSQEEIDAKAAELHTCMQERGEFLEELMTVRYKLEGVKGRLKVTRQALRDSVLSGREHSSQIEKMVRMANAVAQENADSYTKLNDGQPLLPSRFDNYTESMRTILDSLGRCREIQEELTQANTLSESRLAEIERLRGALSEASATREEITQKMETLRTEIGMAKAESAEKEEEKNRLRQRLDAANTRNDTLQEQLTQANEEKAEKDQEIEEKTAALARKEEELEGNSQTIAGLQTDLVQAETDKGNQIQDLQREFGLARDELLAETDAVKTELETKKVELDAKEAVNRDLSAVLARCATAKEELDAQLKEAQAKVSVAEKTLKQLRSLNTGLQEEQGLNAESLRVAQEKIGALEAEKAKNADAISELEAEVKKYNKEIASLNGKISTCEKTILNNVENIESLRRSVQNMNDTNQSLGERNKEVVENLDEQARQLDECQSELSRLKFENERYQTSHRSAEELITTLRNERQVAVDRQKELQGQMEGLRRLNEDIINSCNNLEQENRLRRATDKGTTTSRSVEQNTRRHTTGTQGV
ncbi:unnamed protein product [Ectocarpus sp. 12 AP-2014]